MEKKKTTADNDQHNFRLPILLEMPVKTKKAFFLKKLSSINSTFTSFQELNFFFQKYLHFPNSPQKINNFRNHTSAVVLYRNLAIIWEYKKTSSQNATLASEFGQNELANQDKENVGYESSNVFNACFFPDNKWGQIKVRYQKRDELENEKRKKRTKKKQY